MRGYPCWFADEIREGFHPGGCPDGNAFAGLPVEDRDVSPGRIFVQGSAVTKNLFIGKEHDAETGWDYFGPGRYYSGPLGRWLSVDPIFDKYPGWSPYAYVYDNPVNFFDPDGKEGLGAAIRQDQRARRYLNREITREQYLAETKAEAAGAALGISVVSAPLAASAGVGFDILFNGSSANSTVAGSKAGITELLISIPGLGTKGKIFAAMMGEVIGGITGRSLTDSDNALDIGDISTDILAGFAGNSVTELVGGFLSNSLQSLGANQTNAIARRLLTALSKKTANELVGVGAGNTVNNTTSKTINAIRKLLERYLNNNNSSEENTDGENAENQ